MTWMFLCDCDVVLVIGFSLYLAYGLSISNRLLIITNSVSIAATVTTLVLAGALLDRSTIGAEGSGVGVWRDRR